MKASEVRPLGPGDIPALVDLVGIALPDTMAARLGPRFALQYFRALLVEPEVLVDGYLLDGDLVGFIAYTADVRSALRAVYFRHAVALSWALLPTLRSPRRTGFVLRIVKAMLAGDGGASDRVPAEVLSLALLPRVRGAAPAGEGPPAPIAEVLLTRACAELASRRVEEVKLFCKPEEIEPIANRFFRRQGFAPVARVRRYGIQAILYVKALSAPSGSVVTPEGLAGGRQ